MRSIKMNRLELLKIVQENRLKHVQEYEESVVDFKAAVLKIAAENSKLAKSGDLNKIAKMKAVPNKPQSYETEYHKAIRMLELGVEDVIEVEEDIFNQLVLDEWQWKRSFAMSAAMYKSF